MNKWTLETKENFSIDGKSLTRTNILAVPPTDGNRTDIIDDNGRYHYGVSRQEFIKNLSNNRTISISLIIEIKNGEIELKYK